MPTVAQVVNKVMEIMYPTLDQMTDASVERLCIFMRPFVEATIEALENMGMELELE
jgi:hypothetical protein